MLAYSRILMAFHGFPIIMSVNIEMPKLSDTMSEGTLIKWHKKVGDTISIGDILAEVETDKATMEMEAFDEGVITAIVIQEGEKAPIGGVLAVLDGDDESTTPEPSAGKTTPAPTPVAVKQASSQAAAASPQASASGRVKASPHARKVAGELGVDLSKVSGTGPAGRIVKEDVEKASSANASSPKQPSQAATAAAKLVEAVKARATAATAPVSAPAAAPIMPTPKEGDERIELSSMRKVIASRLLTSKTTIPHFYLHLEVDAAPLMELRKQVNEQAEKTHGNKYSVNDFILKATINAVQAVPAINASFAGDHIVKFKHVGL